MRPTAAATPVARKRAPTAGCMQEATRDGIPVALLCLRQSRTTSIACACGRPPPRPWTIDKRRPMRHHPPVRSLLSELRRRNVFRVGAAYLVAAWLVIQLVETILPAFGFGDSAVRLVVILLAVGLIPVLVLAWVFEVTPEGIKRDEEADQSAAAVGSRKQRLNRALVALLILAVGYFAADRFVLNPDRGQAPPGAAAPAAEPVASTPVPAAPDARSVAVLPFVAMSSGENDEYFADGLTEEILNALASLPELLVTARTSAFHFKGTDLPIPEIAATLGVAHVVEGSVRRSGERVRMTAQLIRAADGFHLWSQTYDRTLEDVFAVQEDIARNIAEVLEVALDQEALARMRQAGLGDVEAFVAYQKGFEAFGAAHSDLRNVSAALEAANYWFDQVLAAAPHQTTTRLLRADLLGHRLFEVTGGFRAEERPGEAAEIIAALQDEYQRAWKSAQPGAERTLVEVERTLFAADWTGLAARLDEILASEACIHGNWSAQMGLPHGRAAATEAWLRRFLRCDPLSGIATLSLVWAQIWSGQADAALVTLDEAQARQLQIPYVGDLRVAALLATGRHAEEPQAWAPGVSGSLLNFPLELLREALAGDPARARQLADEIRAQAGRDDLSRITVSAVVGDRAAANAAAAGIDARPGGPFLLQMAMEMCMCGAPFDLEATPNFQARLRESGLGWPPPTPIDYPMKDW